MANPIQSNRSPLLAIPPELRIHIYEHTYDENCRCEIRIDSCDSVQTYGAEGAIKLLQTCKTIHREALPVLYERMVFDVRITGQKTYVSSDDPKAWTQRTLQRREDLCHIRHVELRVRFMEAEVMDRAITRLEAFAGKLSPESGLKSWRIHWSAYERHGKDLLKFRDFVETTFLVRLWEMHCRMVDSEHAGVRSVDAAFMQEYLRFKEEFLLTDEEMESAIRRTEKSNWSTE